MRTVFVVDDDQLMREVVSRTLTRLEIRVRTFGSAQALLDRFEFECPHLIISDVKMPAMTGLDLLEIIRRGGSDVPVILMSAHLSSDIEAQAAALGVAACVSKPIKDRKVFVEQVLDAIDDPILDADVPGLDSARARTLTRLAHELRTPLTAIRAALDGLVAERTLSGEEQRIASIGQRNLDRLARLIERELGILQDEIIDTNDEAAGTAPEPELQR